MWIFFVFIHIDADKNSHVTFVVWQGIETLSHVDIHIIHIIHTFQKSSIHKGLRGVGGLLFLPIVLQYIYLTDAGVSHAGSILRNF